MCQKFILQKERQVFIKCILRNVQNSYVFVHIGRRYCGHGTVTPSSQIDGLEAGKITYEYPSLLVVRKFVKPTFAHQIRWKSL